MVQPKKKELAQALNRSGDDNKYQWVPFTVYTLVSQLTAQLLSPCTESRSTVSRGILGHSSARFLHLQALPREDAKESAGLEEEEGWYPEVPSSGSL